MTRCRTGFQWRLCRTGVMWSQRRTPDCRGAAVFCTDCSDVRPWPWRSWHWPWPGHACQTRCWRHSCIWGGIDWCVTAWDKLCAWRHNMPRPSPPRGRPSASAPPSRRNVAALSHTEYVPTLTAAAALRVKASLSKSAWWPCPVTFWPSKWCPSHVWRELSLCKFLFS